MIIYILSKLKRRSSPVTIQTDSELPVVTLLVAAYNEEGYIGLTERYHLEKGYCCGNGCKHCPYQYENVPEPKRTELLQKKNS